MAKALRDVLRDAADSMARAYESAGLTAAEGLAMKLQADVYPEMTKQYKRAVSFAYARLMRAAGGKSFSNFVETKADADELVDERRLVQIITSYARANAQRKSWDIANTTKIKLGRIVAAGIRDELGPAAIADRIRDKFLSMSDARSRVIARTETHAAMQYGSLEAATSSDVVESKTWLSAADDRVRDDHLAMNNDTVKLDAAFNGPADGMMFPGDPSGPADQVINCRCVMIFNT
jgi:hypothetical protein